MIYSRILRFVISVALQEYASLSGCEYAPRITLKLKDGNFVPLLSVMELDLSSFKSGIAIISSLKVIDTYPWSDISLIVAVGGFGGTYAAPCSWASLLLRFSSSLNARSQSKIACDVFVDLVVDFDPPATAFSVG